MGWRDKYKAEEQAWMVLKDQYSEVARAMGFPGDAWFDDPLASHAEIVARAAEVASLREQMATAKRVLAGVTDAFIEKHGCFPLDNRIWKEALGAAYDLVGQRNTPDRAAKVRFL